jgi:acetylornithine deacetylase/succinyl-diaminopimelate desuccinylase-like protein
MTYRIPVALLMLIGAAATHAVGTAPDWEQSARAILEHAVAQRTVAGSGRVPALAQFLAEQLRQGGFAESDIEIRPHGETAALLARYRGRGDGAPLVLSAHMDVVEARAQDWMRDPFSVTQADGFLYGRGVMDNKFELSMVVSTLVRLKHERYVPARDIVLALSGDEETAMASSRALAERLRGAWLVVNTDGDANPLDAAGKPLAFRVQAGEKTYADFELRVHNDGGHSSRPRADNAIYQLAHALVKLESHEFPVELSELTRAYLGGLAQQAGGEQRELLARMAQHPGDVDAAARLGADPEYVGILRTTCVATMVAAGHAPNALAQQAVGTVNCRILPGTRIDDVQQRLRDVIADPAVEVVLLERYPDAPASPLREDVFAALRKAVDLRYPGLELLPAMAVGASDNLYFRAAGIDSYAITSLFMHPEDDYTHGLDERVPADAIAPALAFWHTLIRELTREQGPAASEGIACGPE